MSWNIELPDTEFYIGYAGNRYLAKDQPMIKTAGCPEFTQLVNEVADQKELSIDTETTGLCLWRDTPLYWSLAWGIRRVTMRTDTLQYFTHVFANPSIQWIFANAKYDAHILANVGIYFAGDLIDTQVEHALLYEDRRHALKLMADHVLHWTWADFETTFGSMGTQLGKERAAMLAEACQQLGPVSQPIDSKRIAGPEDLIRIAEYFNLPLLAEYASNDAWGALLIHRELKRQLQGEGTFSLFLNRPPYISTLWDLFDKVEKPYTKVLWKMERRGIRLDKAKLEAAEPEAKKAVDDIHRKITQLAGRPINPNSPTQVREWLIEQEGLKPLKMSKGGASGVRNASVDSKFLEHYQNEHPGPGLILEHRKYSKLYGTYIVGLHEVLDPYDRIHSKFNQDVARTGRLSSSEPNLQNIPKPENDQWKLRYSFITIPGWKIIAADYSQLEMRLLAAAALEQDMVNLFLDGKDIHMGNASLMYNIPYEDIVIAKKLDKKSDGIPLAELIQMCEEAAPGIMGRCGADLPQYLRYCFQCRYDAKSIGFGLNYGMGARKLAGDLGCTQADAIAKIKTYKETYPAVDKFMKEAVEEGREYGYSFTLMGRRRNIPMINSTRNDERALGERLAVNTQIQGSAADVCRAAQLNLDSFGLDTRHNCLMLLQVHDELVFECPEETSEEAMIDIKELMDHPFCDELLVPMVAELGIGDSWGEAK